MSEVRRLATPIVLGVFAPAQSVTTQIHQTIDADRFDYLQLEPHQFSSTTNASPSAGAHAAKSGFQSKHVFDIGKPSEGQTFGADVVYLRNPDCHQFIDAYIMKVPRHVYITLSWPVGTSRPVSSDSTPRTMESRFTIPSSINSILNWYSATVPPLNIPI